MTEIKPTIALIPLDERPVNTRYPEMIAAIAGARVLLPPPAIRGRQRVPADLEATAAWLQEAASGKAQAAIVSCDYLGYGNLINARISGDSAAQALSRLSILAEINRKCPVHAFSLITRVSNADDAVEEPLYWAQWGTTFYRYARLAHQRELAAADPESAERRELELLEEALPGDLKADWLRRRLRNHTVNLGLLDLAARGELTSLLLTSDDTAAYGFPSRERDWLRGWPRLVGESLASRVMMHPGADEVGSALTAKLINQYEGRAPRVWVEYAVPGGEEIVAPYEDRPIRETVNGQIAASGCVPAEHAEAADFILGVATPTPRRTDYRPEFTSEDRETRTSDYRAFLHRLGSLQSAGQPVALADTAYPNGSDPILTEYLLESDSPLQPASLAAYGAWNTAGNTLGTVIAQASCALRIGDSSERRQAQNLFLTHRFLEDYGYQLLIRREARAEAERLWGRREPDAESEPEQQATCRFIETRLGVVLRELQVRGLGVGVRIAPGSVRLPWRRTFEADFDLTANR